MRIFSTKNRFDAGKSILSEVSCSITRDELVIIKQALEKIPPYKGNDVLESIRTGVINSIQELSI